MMRVLQCLVLAGCLAASGLAGDVQPKILEKVPHDPKAFTQGLLIDGEVWLESTGLYGKSDVREVERTTGKILRKTALPAHWFGEGLCLLNGKLYQLTWRAGVGQVLDRETFQQVGTFRYKGEGWGLTTDGRWLFLSDGTDVIRVLDPETFEVVRTIPVREEDRKVIHLNELEWIEGELWANVWMTKRIVRIDPDTGKVVGGLIFPHLPQKEDQWPGQDVFNGIAVDPKNGQIWVTGKLWKAVYRIEWPMKAPMDSSAP